MSIIVRGANDLAIAGNRNPLFVIDGVIASDDASLKVGGNPLTSLNPDDIETFTVLKDAAAAAIYGSRAANGVVIITTKKGRYNQHPMLSANVSHTFILQPLLPERIGGNAERLARLEAMKNYAGVYYDPGNGFLPLSGRLRPGQALRLFLERRQRRGHDRVSGQPEPFL